MKCIIFSVCLFLLTTTACCSPSMPIQQQPKSYLRKSSSVLALPLTPAPIPKPDPVIDIPFRKKDQKIVIMVDPGHGGDDFGTNPLGSAKYHEKYLNLSTSQLLKDYLNKMGYAVILTRTDDTFISLDQRSDMANQKKADLFVSVHYNSAPSTDANGIEVFYYHDNANPNRMKKSKALARAVIAKMIEQTQAKSRGIKQGNLAVIRETNMPAILIEGGFMTNTHEMEKIKKLSYQKSIAQGIAHGIHDYLVNLDK